MSAIGDWWSSLDDGRVIDGNGDFDPVDMLLVGVLAVLSGSVFGVVSVQFDFLIFGSSLQLADVIASPSVPVFGLVELTFALAASLGIYVTMWATNQIRYAIWQNSKGNGLKTDFNRSEIVVLTLSTATFVAPMLSTTVSGWFSQDIVAVTAWGVSIVGAAILAYY